MDQRMSHSSAPKRSAFRSILLGLAVLISALICLGGLILTASGIILVMSPPFGPAMLAAGLFGLLCGIGMMRFFMRQI